MKVIGINGSPRKKWNTATLVQDALDGAAEAGAETELVNLYDLDFRGCTSCFSCKRVGLEEHSCAMRDGLTQVLGSIADADALVVGSPIYFNGLSAMTDEELTASIQLARTNEAGSGLADIFGKCEDIVRPQEVMFTPSQVHIYKKLGIKALCPW